MSPVLEGAGGQQASRGQQCGLLSEDGNSKEDHGLGWIELGLFVVSEFKKYFFS